MPGQAGFDQLTIEEQIRYIKGFDEIVTSSASLIDTGWSDPSPGTNLTRWISTPITAHSYLTLRGLLSRSEVGSSRGKTVETPYSHWTLRNRPQPAVMG